MTQYKVIFKEKEMDGFRNFLFNIGEAQRAVTGERPTAITDLINKFDGATKIDPVDKAKTQTIGFDSVFFGKGTDIKLRVNLDKEITADELPKGFLG